MRRVSAVLIAGIAFCTVTLSAAASEPGKIDYAYYTNNDPAARSIVVIGLNLSGDKSQMNACQTRTRRGGRLSAWHDAAAIVRAKQDQYTFAPTGDVSATDVLEVRVKDAGGRYTEPVVVGDGTDYWERVLTDEAPRDCIGSNVQVRWCRDPRPSVVASLRPDRELGLGCSRKGDRLVVSVHFKPGTVSEVKLAFIYSQIGAHGEDKSHVILKYARAEYDSDCPLGEDTFVTVMSTSVCTRDKQQCLSSASYAFVPTPQDVAVYFVIEQQEQPFSLTISDVHIESTLAGEAGVAAEAGELR